MDIKEAINNKNIYRHPWELARLEIVKKELQRITKNIEIENTNVIDIGCGDLFVLEKISSYFSFKSLIGVDTAIDNETIKLKEKEYRNTRIEVYNNLNKVKIDSNSITVILLLDVVEHIRDDVNFLNHLLKYDFVNKDTIFYLTVPSFQSLFCKHDVFLEHYRRYSNSQLISVLQKTNYKIIRNGYFFSILLLPRFWNIIKERLSKKTEQKDLSGTGLTKWNKGKFITFTIRNILLADYFFLSFMQKLKIKLPGLSNYVVCKKHV